jgi:hypothetical protein
MSVHSDHKAFVAVHCLYVISGPSGVYVGYTQNPHLRKIAWWSRARCIPKFEADPPLARAMRRDGAHLYTFEVVAQTKGSNAALETEVKLIEQLRGEGLRVLNVHPIPNRRWLPEPVQHG